MNGKRKPKKIICELPQKVRVTFGKSGAPPEKVLRPVFRHLNGTGCLARLKIDEYSEKFVTVILPEKLAHFGPGRYEIAFGDQCCTHCDSVEIEFQAECEIVDCEILDKEVCDELACTG